MHPMENEKMNQEKNTIKIPADEANTGRIFLGFLGIIAGISIVLFVIGAIIYWLWFWPLVILILLTIAAATTWLNFG